MNDPVWNLLWVARMGMVDRNATITPNEEALARASKLKEMDTKMGMLAPCTLLLPTLYPF